MYDTRLQKSSSIRAVAKARIYFTGHRAPGNSFYIRAFMCTCTKQVESYVMFIVLSKYSQTLKFQSNQFDLLLSFSCKKNVVIGFKSSSSRDNGGCQPH
jgi:hypothetical protein